MKNRLLLVPVLLALAGCANRNVDPNRLPRQPKSAPKAPSSVAMKIDPSLVRRADNVIAGAFAADDPVLRANAIEATQKTVGAAGSERILAGLNDSAPLVRFAACMAAGQVPVPAAYARVAQLADDPYASVQIGARFALHKLGDKRLSHDFEKYVLDPDPRVRGNAVLAIGLLGEASGLKLLRQLQKEYDPAVRLEIVEARYRLGDEDARNQLVIGTVSAYPDDQIVSILALASTHDARVGKNIWGQLVSDYPEVALAAARALGEIAEPGNGGDDGMQVALNYVDAKDPRQRSMAALALGDIGRTDAQPALGKLLDDPDASVRLAAATAVLQLKY